MDSTRQQKVARQIQKDISDIFTKETPELFRGVMVSVTGVRMSPDLGYAKIYISVFPFERAKSIMDTLEENNRRIRKSLGALIRNQLKAVPELSFFLDDSFEYSENIDRLLQSDGGVKPSEE